VKANKRRVIITLNRIILIGRLTKDPDLRYTQSGKAVTNFTIAVDRPFKNANGEKEADFINIVVWGTQAENAANYLSKGKLVAIDGALRIRSYDGQDGQRRWVTEVVADNVRYLSPRNRVPGEDVLEMGTDMGMEVEFDDSIPF
jgi:single-strand DNA-binding protein